MRHFVQFKRKGVSWNPRGLRGVVLPLACIVLFWTVYALILPAITQEKQANCGLEAHSHSAQCYDDAGALCCDLSEHTHTDACYADLSADLQTPADWEPEVKKIALSGDWAQDTLAVSKTQLGYRASDVNYTVSDDGTRSPYSRYGVWAGEPYGAWNSTFAAFCLHYAGIPDEAVPEAGKAAEWLEAFREAYPDAVTEGWQPGDLVFLDRDGDGEADTTAFAEKLLNAEADAPERVRLIAGDVEGAVRSFAVPTGEGKISAFVSLASVREDYEAMLAGQEKPAESPSEPEEPAYLSGALSFEGNDFTVTAEFDAAAQFPAGTTLSVREILPGTAEYEIYFKQSAQRLDGAAIQAARFFDVTFLLDGETIEPAAPVEIHTQYAQCADDTEDARVIHFTQEGTELLPVETERQDGEITGFLHSQDGFSVIGYLVTSAANETDVGPELLPVDYYVYIDGRWQCVGSTATGWLGDYDSGGWSDYNRDYVTVEQVASILAPYGFSSSVENAARVLSYQQKKANGNDTVTDMRCYSDTNAVEVSGKRIIPMARHSLRANANAGYNLYYIPTNTTLFSGKQLKELPTSGSEFYTVRVYDPQGLSQQTLPAPVTVRAGASVQIRVAPLPDGLQWQCVSSGWQTVAFTQTPAGGSVTLTVQNVTQPTLFTPTSKDGRTSYSKSVRFMVYLDDSWMEAGSVSTIYKMDGHPRFFITAAQAESVLAPYGFRASEYAYTSGDANSVAHQLGVSADPPGSTFYTDNDAWRLSDGSWAIGLSYENGDHVVYWIPGVTGKATTTGTAKEYAAAHPECRFWTVSVRDSNQLVYSSGEAAAMKWYVRNGEGCTVSLKTADGVFWSAYGKDGRTVKEEHETTADGLCMTVSGVDQTVQITATASNPEYTVQYYADTQVFATSGGTSVPIIDTSAAGNGTSKAKLPDNKSDPKFRYLYLENTGKPAAGMNNGDTTNYYRVATTRQEVQLYTDAIYQLHRHPDVSYVDRLANSGGYDLAYVGVLKEGKASDSINDDDFIWYAADGIVFTNVASEADSKTILVEKGSVIRLFYEPANSSYINSMNLYDYDINSRSTPNAAGKYETGIVGINSKENYGTSRNGKTNWNTGADTLAFGNANTGTGMGNYKFDSIYLNKYSGRDVVGGCTFGLVERLDASGNIIYNPWVIAPKLFDDDGGAAVTGKHTYTNGQLTFERTGDTYVLSSASHPETGSVDKLNYFFHPSPTAGTVHNHIFTNDFWPMDSVSASNRTDPLFGAYGQQISYQGFANADGAKPGNFSDYGHTFPTSDDGRGHNSYFGMHFAVNFSLTADYVGPLEYYFFGDDDMWVFLDGQLVCDIGGVHSSMGEYVNLRDYLPNGSTGTHTLAVFYTERGASGSTCWMSFTLPTVSGAVTGQEVGSLEVSKRLQRENGSEITDSDERFRFQIDFLTGENGAALHNTFAYSGSDGSFGSIRSGQTVLLHGGESLTVSGIPAGTRYTVRELDSNGYTTTVNGASGYVVSGQIASNQSARADYINTTHYELPDSGGSGADCFLFLGIGLLALFACCLYIRLYKKKNAPDSNRFSPSSKNK